MSLSASMPITGFNILVGNNRLTPVQILCELGGSFLFIRKVVHSVLTFLINKNRSARMRPDACGICLLKQTASGAQSVTSPSKTEGFREFEADLSALFMQINMIDVIM